MDSREDIVEQKLRAAARKGPPRKAYLLRMGRLLEKRNAGKCLRPREAAELDEFIAGGQGESSAGESSPPPQWVHSRDALAKELGCHPNSIPRWLREFKQDPLIKTLKRANGDYNVAAWKEFVERHGITITGAGGRLGELELAIKEEILRAKRRENDEQDRALIRTETIVPWVVGLASRLRSRLKSLERELPPRLHGLDQAGMAARLKPVFNELIEEFSKNPPARLKSRKDSTVLEPSTSPIQREVTSE